MIPTRQQRTGRMLRDVLAALCLAAASFSGARAAGILSQGSNLAIAPVPTSITDDLAAEQRASAVEVQAQDQLARITTALQAMQNLQNSARNLALASPSTVPDGLQNGGLVPNTGLASPGVANPVDWTGAQTPVQTSAAGQTTVTINQTAAQALLSWNSFNISRNTTLDFNQQGNTNWVALNKVNASTAPSEILGAIKASGQVYVIDPNGIIFGGASQINVGALVASTADLSTSQFLTNGIYSPETNQVYTPSFTNAGGAVTVQAGAVINTAAPPTVTTGGGYVLLLGTQVQNAGTINTPEGQTELAAGDNFLIRTGYSTSSNIASTTRGNEVAVQLNNLGSSLTGGSGLVENTGDITADTGDVTLAGETVIQNGVLESTTSVAVRGTIHLLSSASDKFGSVTLGGNGYTLIEPDLSSTDTELDSQRAALIADSATANGERAPGPQFDDLSLLPDQEENSRIEIVSGGSVQFAGGSDSSAPGGDIAVSAADRIEADSGAIVDVAGSTAVPMTMQSNDIAVNIQNYELRDDPQNRLTQDLRNSTVYVDAQTVSVVPASSADDAARAYTAGGLLEVSGYIANIGHTIGQYTAIGGSIDLSTGDTGAIVTQSGSKFNIAGGSLHYAGGDLQQSYLMAADGQIYNVNTAPAGIIYTGVYNGFSADHATWNVTQTYANVFGAPAEVYEDGYTVGRAAGSLTLSSPTTIFNGDIEADTVNGVKQTAADPTGVTDSYLFAQNDVAEPGSVNIGLLDGVDLIAADTDVAFGTTAPAFVGLTKKIPKDLVGTTIFDAGKLSGFGLGALQVITDGSIDISAALAFAPGAQVGLYGSSVDIGADVTTAGGSVTASQIAPGVTGYLALPKPPKGGSSSGDIVLADGATISTAGLWSNLMLDPKLTFTQAYVNGGAVDLASVNNLTLGSGSVIDTDAGGIVTQTGAEKGGAGGALSLAAAATPLNTVTGLTGNLTLGGTLTAAGATSGGALTLAAPSFLISTMAPLTADPSLVWLDPAFFSSGFSAYNLVSTGDITVAPGTAVAVTEPTDQFTAASADLATGSSPGAGYTLALLPLYAPNAAYTAITQRPGASFSAAIITPGTTPSAPSTLPSVLNGVTLSIGAGAAIDVDPGKTINLIATGQLTIDGSLVAPGGIISATSNFNTQAALPGGPGTVSVWLGPDAVLDADAAPVSFTNEAGQEISLAPAGGSITLGKPAALGASGSTASIIIRQGALIEASGSAAVDDTSGSSLASGGAGAVSSGQAVSVQGAGGSITLNSDEGIYNDGTLIAAAGGPDAAGGQLALSIEADSVLNSSGAEAVPRIFTITQDDPGALLPADLQPGQSGTLTPGTAAISAQQITAGGFGSVSLFTRDAFNFAGDVTLSAPQSISLREGYITDASATGSVALDAPYVSLSGATFDVNSGTGAVYAVISGYSAQTASGAFTINASLIDIANGLRLGGVLPGQGGGAATDLAGFGTLNLNSSGDIQFNAPTGAFTDIVTAANINLTAREIYFLGSTASQSGAGYLGTVNDAVLIAGFDPMANGANGNFNPQGVLTINAAPGTTPSAPDTLGGAITLEAATIRQSGVIWQPLGDISFGGINALGDQLGGSGDSNTSVDLLPGSITSVSAAGLDIPFGGTTDGVTYDVNGNATQSNSSNVIAGPQQYVLPGVTNGVTPGTITFSALTTDVQAGADIDLQGGGTLTGAGFISGEGGSTDATTTPLLQFTSTGVTQPTLATNPVYAIVAGQQPVTAVAYTQSGAVGSVPALGEQIVIPAGVPGLAAGSYTLLPAAYALEPGGYRVEFDGNAALDAASVATLPNGSYMVKGATALADTNVRGTLPSNFTITPGATVLNYSAYDQEGYSAFLEAIAAENGAIRPVLPIDAGTLILDLPAISSVTVANDGSVDFDPASGGAGGTLQVAGVVNLPVSLDIYGAAPAMGLAAGTVSLSAAQLDSFNPYTLELGVAGGGGQSHVTGVTLENGASLHAARVVVTAQSGGITLDSGAAISTLGEGTIPVDSATYGPLQNNGASVLDVANGYVVYGTPPPDTSPFYGPVTVADGADVYSGGSIAISTSDAVSIGDNANFGAADLDLAVSEINIGDPQALGATVPPGVLLTPAVLQTLSEGRAALGVPALQNLNLTASESLNFYGTTALDFTGGNAQLEINTPAIYGFGSISDVATIAANSIVWNGISATDPQTDAIVSSLPGGPVANGPGSGAGTLDLNAQSIILGYSDLDIPQRDASLNRLTLGFATVNLNATQEITTNNMGTLAVYQAQPVYGQAGIGGTLNLNTPLVTAANAATLGLTAGGSINAGLAAGENVATGLMTEAAGGELDLTAPSIGIDDAVILPSGKLDLQATGDITLAAGSLINLAGTATFNHTETVYGFGGTLIANSAAGNITQAAGSVIDVSAINNNAGSISLNATGAGAGRVALNGTLLGAAAGTLASGDESGSITLGALDLGDFSALNASLDTGGFFQSRSFDLQQGDLAIGDGVQAHHIVVSVDDGSLTVSGLIDASGNGGGSISLAASDDLTLTSTAVLNAQGTVEQIDGSGNPIPSENTPEISLTTSSGELSLNTGAQLNLSPSVIDANAGVNGGDLELNVPRLGGATAGDANIDAGTVAITGAGTIAVNAFQTYNGLPDPNVTVDNAPDALITQAYLDQINTSDTLPFMAAAAANADLAARVAGLSGYAAYQLRPGVQIVSATPNGDLTVDGDIDLSGYRYGSSINPRIYGSGAPGVLEIRAGGNLNVFGSITDGFAPPAVSDAGTEFAQGWVIYSSEPFNEPQTVPTAIGIAAESTLSASMPVNYAVPITGGTFQAGAVVPASTPLTVRGAQTIPDGFVATSAITSASGQTLFLAGQVVPAGTVLPDGATIAPGGTLPVAITVGPVTWPADTPFTVTTMTDNAVTVTLATNLTLQAGSLVPGGSALIFQSTDPGIAKNGSYVETRAVIGGKDGTQGQLDGLASLLPAGDLSWSIGLVSGAYTTAASPDIVKAATTLGAGGNITLADTHYGVPKNASPVPTFSVIRTGTGSLNLVAGGSINEESSFGVYTAGAQSAAILDGMTNPYNLPQGDGQSTSLLGTKNTAEAELVSGGNYAANYPIGGGNVLVEAQNSLHGFIYAGSAISTTDSDAEGGWLWRQGGAGESGAWWIEYGSLNLAPGTATLSGKGALNGKGGIVEYTGFQGIGTLGGGNLQVNVGGNASGLDLVVASNGRVTPAGTVVDGGGSLTANIGGAINFFPAGDTQSVTADEGGLISDLRGNTALSAASVGTITPDYQQRIAGNDLRSIPPLQTETATTGNGIDLLPGDGAVTVDSAGDLVIDGVGNPGTVLNVPNTTPVLDTALGIDTTSIGETNFSLWTAATGVNLFSAGGNVAPVESNNLGTAQNAGADDFYTPNLSAIAQNGDIYVGIEPIELAPSQDGQLQLLAADSIIGGDLAYGTQSALISISGAPLSAVATPSDPDITVYDTSENPIYTTHNDLSPQLLIDFAADTPTGALHALDTQPAVVSAANGDIVNIQFGLLTPQTTVAPQAVQAAKPFDIYAGRDIVDSGSIDSPDIFLNLGANDITSITAGRDIIESSFDIAGPGNLVVQAGRDYNAANNGVIDSIGPIFDIDPSDRNDGAGVAVLAGVGAAGPDYAGFADAFVDPASTLSLTDASAIISSNDATLYSWLQTHYGYKGTQGGAYAYFLTLSPSAQDVFLRQVYFAELNNSGLEFNNPESVRYKSYVLGKTAIADLFPAMSNTGQALTYSGDITMFGDSGIHTDFGGAIETLTPGGETIVGVEGATPPASAGVITQGSGDIDMYALDSVLLGESRVLTTFGGGIVIWSAQGDINAGKGSKTTIEYTPLQRLYDVYGDVFLSPTVPSSGAGIATLNPIPSVPAGNINLVAPLGTVDAGEAGIRGSGNLNIAALHVLNAANIQVQGATTGVPTTSAPNIGALSSTSAAAGAAAQAAESSTAKSQPAPQPSIWIVEILGYGGSGTSGEIGPAPARKNRHVK